MTERSWIARIDRHGPVLVAGGIVLLSLAYLADAIRASTRLHNLILLVPLVALIIAIAIGIMIMFVRKGPDTREASEEEAPEGTVPIPASSIASMMVALLIYAFIAPSIGFDLASALFIAFCLYVQGERRWWFIVVFSILFSAATTWSLIHIAGTAVPTLII